MLRGAVHILRNAVGGEGGFGQALLFVTGRGVGGQECVTSQLTLFFATTRKFHLPTDWAHFSTLWENFTPTHHHFSPMRPLAVQNFSFPFSQPTDIHVA